jgi:sarcosine oxidase, subunit beta
MADRAVPGDPRVAVVGAGIIGCSAAFHLLNSGLTSLTLIDAVKPGGATTGAGAGFVSHWSAGFLPELGEEGLVLQQYGLEFYRMLHGLGTEIGFRPSGTLQLSLTEEGFERFARPVLDSPLAPRGTRRLSPDEVGDVMRGLVDPRQVYGGVLNPDGIQVETGLAMSVLADQIRRLGAELRLDTKVLAIDETGGAIRIHTDHGRVDADLLVIAAGAWNNELLAMVDWRLPLLRILATRVVTDNRALPSPLPTVQCREFRLWLRECFGAITWGSAQGYAPLHRLEAHGEALPPGQPYYPQMLDSLLDQQRNSLERVFPPLRGSSVASWSQGVPCYTPDHNLIVGRVPQHPSILVAGGDNESGVTHGPGLGRLIADLALERPPFVDPRRWQPARFDSRSYPTEEAVESALAKSFVVSSVHLRDANSSR